MPPDVGRIGCRAGRGIEQTSEWTEAEELEITIIDITGAPAVVVGYFRSADYPLYTRPELESRSPSVAIVGTRRPTGTGLNCSERLAEDRGKRGIVTSELARGIDASAHRGALRGGVTYAGFGSSLDFVYPKENRKLAENTVEKGAVLSEFPLGTAPAPQNFPIRNRIIAGMSLGVVVIEAAEYSGSLITVRLPLESNREVFAVPGNITSPKSFGPSS